MTVKVVNKYKDFYDIYIGRGSVWGNPFSIGKHGDRDGVIDQYKDFLWNQIKLGLVSKDQLIALDGKTLGCFCKPQACHGDVIAKAVEWALKRR